MQQRVLSAGRGQPLVGATGNRLADLRSPVCCRLCWYTSLSFSFSLWQFPTAKSHSKGHTSEEGTPPTTTTTNLHAAWRIIFLKFFLACLSNMYVNTRTFVWTSKMDTWNYSVKYWLFYLLLILTTYVFAQLKSIFKKKLVILFKTLQASVLSINIKY